MITHKAPISGIAAHGNWIATAGYDNQVILWDAKSEQATGRVQHDHLANQVSFSPCGNFLASASSDHTARIWSMPDLKLLAVLTSHTDDVEMVSFHPTQPIVATACRDHKARLFALDGNLLQTYSGHSADVISLDWSENGEELITTSDDGTVKCWEIETAKLLRDIDMKGVETDTIVIIGEDSIVAGNDKGEITLIRNSGSLSFQAHKAGIKRLKWNAEENLLVSLSYDRSLKIWEKTSGGFIKKTETKLPAEIWPRSVAFAENQKLVLGTFGTSYATFHYLTKTWSTQNVSPTWGRNAVTCKNEDVYSVGDAGIVFRNGIAHVDLGSLCNFLCTFEKSILAGGQQGTVFDAVTGEKIYQHTSPLNCGAVFTRNGQPKAIVGTYTGEGIIFGFDPISHKPKFEMLLKLNENAIKGVSCSLTAIFSVCANGGLSVHSIESFAEILNDNASHQKIANGCCWLEKETFASISRDRILRIWDLKACEHETIPTPHTHSIKCIAASPNGRFLATGSYNGRVSIYDRVNAEWVFDQRLSCSGISALTARGNEFLASCYDGNLYPVRFNSAETRLVIGI